MPPIGNVFFVPKVALKRARTAPALASASQPVAAASASAAVSTPAAHHKDSFPLSPMSAQAAEYAALYRNIPHPLHTSLALAQLGHPLAFPFPGYPGTAPPLLPAAAADRGSSPPPVEEDADPVAYLLAAGLTQAQAERLVEMGYTAGQCLNDLPNTFWADAGFKPLEWHIICKKDAAQRRELKRLTR